MVDESGDHDTVAKPALVSSRRPGPPVAGNTERALPPELVWRSAATVVPSGEMVGPP